LIYWNFDLEDESARQNLEAKAQEKGKTEAEDHRREETE
jgi:hypothetical protein